MSEAGNNYDLIILGAGPGGYVAAERAGAQGKRVLLIEKSELGGVCLNEGCVPSKTLLNSAKLYKYAQKSEAYGVKAEKVSFDLPAVIARKEKVIGTLRKGIAYQMKRFNVEVVQGEGRFVDRRTIAVGDKQFQADHVIIATGSSAIRIPIPGADLPQVWTSREALCAQSLPRQLAVIGGGVIGMEFACFFASVGVAVTVIEMLPEILPNFDPDIATMVRRELKHIACHTGAKVEAITPTTVRFSKDGKSQEIPADAVLMSVGRSPNTQGLGLDRIGLDFDRKGIRVDEHLRTNLPGVYAIGDVTGRMLLAHTASRMGEVVVAHICGEADRMRYHAVPWVVYTTPEVAGVGLTETEAKKQGRKVKVASLQMRANGRFLAEHDRETGLCKVLVDSESQVLLGVHLVGAACSEMVAGFAAMVEAELRVQDIRQIIFPHPTVSEIMRDAVWEIGH